MPEKDITRVFANEIWSGIESVGPFCARQQSPCSVLKASVVFQSFEPASARHAVATRPVGSEIATAATSGDTRLLRIPLRDGGTRSQHVWRIALQSASLHTLVLSHTTKHFQNPEEATNYHAACNTQRDDLGRNVSNAAWHVLMSWISRKLVGWVQLPAFRQEPARPWSDANSTNVFVYPNVERPLCQVSTEEGVLRSTPSALMEVREAVWSKRWKRDAADSVALGTELVALRAQAIAEDVLLLEPVIVEKLDQTLRRIPDNTGIGSGCVQPGAIKHAPVDAKQKFCRILDSVTRAGVLPWWVFHT